MKIPAWSVAYGITALSLALPEQAKSLPLSVQMQLTGEFVGAQLSVPLHELDPAASVQGLSLCKVPVGSGGVGSIALIEILASSKPFEVM